MSVRAASQAASWREARAPTRSPHHGTHRRNRRDPRRSRRCVRAASMQPLGPRISTAAGRRRARSVIGRQLIFQLTIERSSAPTRSSSSAPIRASKLGAERPHPRGAAASCWSAPTAISAIRATSAPWRCRDALKQLADGAAFLGNCRKANVPIVGQGHARAEARAVLGPAARLARSTRRADWNDLPCRIRRPPASRPRPAVLARRRAAAAAFGATDAFSLCADELDPSRQQRLASISPRMALPARTAPTSSCRPPPTPRNPAPTLTPRAACR